MNNYLIDLNDVDKSFEVIFEKDSNTQNLRLVEDNDASMLVDGYFVNEEKFINKYSNLKNITLEELLFQLLKNNFKYQGELDGSFNIFFYDKQRNDFKFINDYWSSRPIYTHKTTNKYLFSNDIPFLKKHIGIVLTPNIRKIRELIAWQLIGSRSTYYNEIDKLGPGIVLTISSKEQSEISLNVIDSDIRNSILDIEDFERIFEAAVIRRAKKFKKIMVMLSGGLDSSAVAVALKNKRYHEAETISANFSHVKEFPNTNEKKYQDNVSVFTNFANNHIEMQNKSVLSDIKKYVHLFHEPMLVPNLYIFEAICKNLTKRNFDAIFDGNDGDNIVSYGFANIYRQFYTLDFISFCRSVFDYAKVHMKSKRSMIKFFVKNSLKKLIGYKGAARNNSLLSENAFKDTEKHLSLDIMDSHQAFINNNLHFVGFENRYRIFRKLGIETVSPFYDKDLINFCVNMPPSFKLNKGNTRYVQREYLSRFLGKNHAFRTNKANLARGLVANFSNADFDIVMNERKHINNDLLKMIDLKKLDAICERWTVEKKVSEDDIINLQIFLNANIFLNSFFK